MKILIHHHKYGDECYRADTPENELWAFHAMFKALDEFDAYIDIEDDGDAKEKALYKKAKAGDHAAAKDLCFRRKDAEYEGWTISKLMEPSVEDAPHGKETKP